jgi:hypothetical protein
MVYHDPLSDKVSRDEADLGVEHVFDINYVSELVAGFQEVRKIYPVYSVTTDENIIT